MPTVTNENMTLLLNVATQIVTISVSYTVTFSQVERNLADLIGYNWHDHVVIQGVDGNNSTELFEFPRRDFAVTGGVGEQAFPVFHITTMPRADLQEDPVGNDDEIRCRIRIHTNDIPVDITEVLTSEQVLVG